MYKAPNGDEFVDKTQYLRWMGNVNRARKNRRCGSYLGERKNKSSRHKHKGICPSCGKKDNLTKDYKGETMCPNCFILSL